MKRLLPVCLALALGSCSASNTAIDVRNTGARGDGRSDDAAAIQKAIDRASAQGGGTVLLTGGHTYLSGPIELKSNVELHIDAGTTLLANPDSSIYQLSAFGANRAEGTMWIHCRDIENLSITGQGTIDGNCLAFMGREAEDSFELKPIVDRFDPRPHVMTLVGVKGLIIKDLTIQGAAYWTVHLAGCENVVIDGLGIMNDLRVRNCDGIDVDHSRNVRISNCKIRSGDDSICLKNRREYSDYGPCTDIVIDNCIMTSKSCAFKIGSENVDEIARVSVSNCIITGSNRGIGIQNRDEGTVHDVFFKGIQLDCSTFSDVWWGKAEPIYITSYPRKTADAVDASWRFPEGAVKGECGKVWRIFLSDIHAVSENGCFVGGDIPGKVSEVFFDNISLQFTADAAQKGGTVDRRPCEGTEFYYGKTEAVKTENVPDSFSKDIRILNTP